MRASRGFWAAAAQHWQDGPHESEVAPLCETPLWMHAPTSGASRTLSGHTFSVDHHHFLCAVARARNWTSRVWVPAPLASLLCLPLVENTYLPLRLEGGCGSSLVYHASQFVLPLRVMWERWDAHVRGVDAAEQRRVASLLASRVPPDTLPLSTNGERFDSVTEEMMLRWGSTAGAASSYWATAAEASWVYGARFSTAFLADPANGVVCRANSICRPVTYYNVRGTVDPSRFTPQTCRRYDPVNYHGAFYRPAVAVRMKMMALRHDYLGEPQWITPHRAALLGRVVLERAGAVAFRYGNLLRLINVGATCLAPLPPAPAPRRLADSDAVEMYEQRYEAPLLLLPMSSPPPG
ncbi:hypothetical protein NESM_000786500 [Novymonas esmeraldas]|uniref:Trypanosoma Tc-38 (p38) protein domain-containing protein n=1 Tax=Novymonas esmeraldas TaxID=1808958 RepID=A0AAW0EYY7_9TRYP